MLGSATARGLTRPDDPGNPDGRGLVEIIAPSAARMQPEEVRRSFALLLLALGAPALDDGCSGGSGNGGTLSVRFHLTKMKAAVECKAAPEVTSVRVTLLGADGLSPLSGYPATADCASGAFSRPAPPPGHYTLTVEALGQLGGDAHGVLYRASQPYDPSTLPGEIDVVLLPQASTLSLSWSFQDSGLDPCKSEVAVVHVAIATGASQSGGYLGDFACGATPVQIPAEFTPAMYLIEVSASSPAGFPLYDFNGSLLLVADDNSYSALLRPQGSRLLFDWQFAGVGITPSCDDPRVAVTSLVARVKSEDDPALSETVECTAMRPYAFRARRIIAGRKVDFELVGEGLQRFEAGASFTMPAEDYDLGVLALRAVGSATVSFTTTATSPCTRSAPAHWGVVVSEALSSSVAWSKASIDSQVRSVSVSDLPFGDYNVVVGGYDASSSVVCSASGRRTITDRHNSWAPFSL
jgi:hypothetical protein